MAENLPRRYKLVYKGRELSNGLLSEAGKYDAFQILVKKYDEGREGAIDPDEGEVIYGNLDWSGVFLRTWLLLLLNVQLF